MRYRSNRQYLHPVLRPDADDYGPDASLITVCEPHYDPSDGMLSIAVRFELAEDSLTQAVIAQRAKCAAMVYCGSTLYRSRLEATPSEPFVARGKIPVNSLKNEVQVHPVILAMRDITHPTDTAHPEYERQSVGIDRLAPLATDLHWTFDINSEPRPVRSIFRLQEDVSGRLNDGEFDVSPDITQDYVPIFANRDTHTAFKAMRGGAHPLPTVFTSAVLAVLATIQSLGEDADDDENCAWLRCVNARLRNHNINIGDGGISLFLAAQRLLESPFAAMLTEFSESDDGDDDSGGYDPDEQGAN